MSVATGVRLRPHRRVAIDVLAARCALNPALADATIHKWVDASCPLE